MKREAFDFGALAEELQPAKLLDGKEYPVIGLNAPAFKKYLAMCGTIRQLQEDEVDEQKASEAVDAMYDLAVECVPSAPRAEVLRLDTMMVMILLGIATRRLDEVMAVAKNVKGAPDQDSPSPSDPQIQTPPSSLPSPEPSDAIPVT